MEKRVRSKTYLKILDNIQTLPNYFLLIKNIIQNIWIK